MFKSKNLLCAINNKINTVVLAISLLNSEEISPFLQTIYILQTDVISILHLLRIYFHIREYKIFSLVAYWNIHLYFIIHKFKHCLSSTRQI